MVDSQKILNTVVPVVIFLLIIGIGAWVVSTVGIPFLNSPDTFKVQDVVTFEETDDEVIVNLQNPNRSEELLVLVDGNEKSWSNNTISISKDSSPTIALEAYPGNQGLYDRYEYPVNQVQTDLQVPDEILVGEQVTFSFQSSTAASELSRNKWYVNDSIAKNGGLGMDYTFNESGKYEVRAETEIRGVKHTTSEEVNVFEPGEIVLDINITSQDLVSFQSFDLRVKELTNQSVEQVEIQWGTGENETLDINDSTRYWYRNPGTYNLTIFGESSVADAEVTRTLTMNVSEREDKSEISRVVVNVFDEKGKPISNASISVGSVSKIADTSGQANIRLLPGTYVVSAEAPGYVESTQEILVTQDDFVMDIGLNPVEPPTDPPDNLGNSLDFGNATDLEYESDSNVTQIPANADEADSLLVETFEDLNGTGTDNNPYEISDYLQMQSIRVQPAAHYELTEDIDASLSRQQSVVTEIDNKKTGTAEDILFDIPYANSEPDDLTVKVGGEEVEESKYQVVRIGDDPISGQKLFKGVFVEDNTATSASELLNVDSDSNINVSYTLEDTSFKGFEPIDAEGTSVNIDGNGYTISNLYINRPLEDGVGILTGVEGAVIKNLRLSAGIRGSDQTGAMIGSGDKSVVRNIQVGGMITGDSKVGSVAGQASEFTIERAYGSATVTGESQVGGLIGELAQGERGSTLTDSYVTTSSQNSISGEYEVGGMVGHLTTSTIKDSYVKSSIIGTEPDSTRIGGISGYVSSKSEVNSVYSVAQMVRSTNGEEDNQDGLGAIAGTNNGTISTAYWDTTVLESPSEAVNNQLEGGSSDNVNGLEGSEMKGTDADQSMTAFDFAETWNLEQNDYPTLQSEVQQYDITIVIEASNGDPVESPIITASATEGDNSYAAEPNDSPTVTQTFNMIEGQYDITIETERYSRSISYAATSEDTLEVTLGG